MREIYNSQRTELSRDGHRPRGTAASDHGPGRSLILTSTFASVSPSFRRAIGVLKSGIDQLDPVTFKRMNQWMTFSQSFQNTREQELCAAERQDMAYPYPMPHCAYKAQCNACLGHDTAQDLGKTIARRLRQRPIARNKNPGAHCRRGL